MFCARLIAGSQSISNHSWGSAIDISVGGILDGVQSRSAKSDGRTLAGLAAMAPFFNRAGWYWGAGFSTFEDGMHFEVADETIRRWHAEGKLGPAATDRTVVGHNLSIGDRGVEVRQLQEALLALEFDIVADGIFGAITRAAVSTSRRKTPCCRTGFSGRGQRRRSDRPDPNARAGRCDPHPAAARRPGGDARHDRASRRALFRQRAGDGRMVQVLLRSISLIAAFGLPASALAYDTSWHR